MIFPIVLYGDPILKKKANKVDYKDESIEALIGSLFETMYAAQGVGLASPQIGRSLRVFVIDSTPMEEDNSLRQAFVNPEIIEKEGEPWIFEEGCLSIPGLREEITRKPVVHVRYYDENWELHKKTFDGMIARIIQHEYDHIEGILFTDHLTSFKKRLLKGKLTNISKGKTDTEYRIKLPRQ